MARKSSDVFDAAPAGAVDVNEAGPVFKDGGPGPRDISSHERQQAAIDDMTRQASTAVSVFANLPAWEPHPTLMEIAKMKEEKLKLIADVGTPAGLKLCKQAKREIVRLRNAVDDRRKEVGKEAYDYKKKVDEAGRTVIEKLQEIEEPLEAAIKAEEQKEIEAALAKAMAIEAEQRAKEEQRLALIQAEKDRVEAERLAKIKAQEEELEAQRKELELLRVEAKRKNEEERAAFQARIESERAEMDRQRKEYGAKQAAQREAQAKIDAENGRLQAEARAKIEEERRQAEAKARAVLEEREATERAEREKAAEERRKVQAEADRLANEKRIEEAKKAAAEQAVKNEQARVAREAEAKRLKEAKDKAAADKKAAQAPDKDKLSKWADSIQAIERPAVKDKEVELALKDAMAVIAAAMTRVYSFCGSK